MRPKATLKSSDVGLAREAVAQPLTKLKARYDQRLRMNLKPALAKTRGLPSLHGSMP